MKIEIDSKSPEHGADIVSLVSLLRYIENYISYCSDDRDRAILETWKSFLINIANDMLKANYGMIPEKSSFEFNFEEEFKKIMNYEREDIS